jgi:hypothetical protein
MTVAVALVYNFTRTSPCKEDHSLISLRSTEGIKEEQLEIEGD